LRDAAVDLAFTSKFDARRPLEDLRLKAAQLRDYVFHQAVPADLDADAAAHVMAGAWILTPVESSSWKSK
jgi:hypothetical protein